MNELEQAFLEEGLDPDRFNFSRSDGQIQAEYGGRVTTGSRPSAVASLAARAHSGEFGNIDPMQDTAAALAEIDVSANDLPDPAAFAEAADEFSSAEGLFDDDRSFVTGGGGAERTLSLYETGEGRNLIESVTVADAGGENLQAVGEAIARASPKTLEELGPDVFGVDEELTEAARERDARRQTRDDARAAAREAGVDLDEFDVTAAYGDDAEPGEVVVQDKGTNQTRTIDADAPGGVGSAIDAATVDGQFVADDADPAASGSGSGDGLAARAAGAIVLVFGAIAAALGWLS